MSRKQAREGAMQLLFQMDVNEDFSSSSEDLFLMNFPFEQSEERFIREITTCIRDNFDVINNHIETNLEGWSIYRLAKVDLAVLRIAICEILYRKDIPVEVSINEAIEVVKKYSNEESFRFVNGVLGSFVRNLDKDGSD